MNANELADLLETTESTNNKAANMLRQQQAKIEKHEQVLQSIANDYVELSYDKVMLQRNDYIRWAKEVLK